MGTCIRTAACGGVAISRNIAGQTHRATTVAGGKHAPKEGLRRGEGNLALHHFAERAFRIRGQCGDEINSG